MALIYGKSTKLPRLFRITFYAASYIYTRNNPRIIWSTAACSSIKTELLSDSVNAETDHTQQDIQLMKKWISGWFKGTRAAPFFPVDGSQTKILLGPTEFYEELKARAVMAEKRIVLGSLYLGTGDLEKQLVNCIHDRLKELSCISQKSSQKLDVQVVLDYMRGSRGTVNSRTLLLPLINEFPDQVKVALFHTPEYRGLLRLLVPERFNETISSFHLKVYLFDDSIIFSGANLSNDYFTNRQDRYIVFENCSELCDYFHDLTKTIASFSMQLQTDDSVTLSKEFSEHPYKGSKKRFYSKAKEIMLNFFSRNSKRLFSSELLNNLTHQSKKDVINTCSDSNEPKHGQKLTDVDAKTLSSTSRDTQSDKFRSDTIVIPLIQMYPICIRQDEIVTSNLLRNSLQGINICLATAYFNLTKKYWSNALNSKGDLKMIMAHPQAMGFYKAPGAAGGVPFAYTYIAKNLYKDIVNMKQTQRLRFLEYLRPGWTFHGKGLWAHVDESIIPFVTLIGSPNFGYRSVYRDLEAQVAMITTNKELSKQLIDERQRLLEYSQEVTEQTYTGEDRKVPFWVLLIATFMRDFF